jgi:hypothetical protein
MNKSGKIGLTAAAFMACTAGAASAGTIVAGTRTSSGTKPFTASQTFPSFGTLLADGDVPAGSVLTDVTDVLTDTLTGNVSGTNLGTGSGTFNVAAEDKTTKTFGTGASALTISTTAIGNSVTGTLAGAPVLVPLLRTGRTAAL